MARALIITSPGTLTTPAGPQLAPSTINADPSVHVRAARIPTTAEPVLIAPSVSGASALLAPNAGFAPSVVEDTTGRRVLRFDGADDVMRIDPLTGPAPVTVIMVATLRRAPGDFDTVGCFHTIGVNAPDLTRWPDGTLSLYAGTRLTGPQLGTGRHVIAAVLNGASSRITVDGSTVTGDAGGTTAANGYHIGTQRGTSVRAAIDVDALLVFARALTGAEVAAEVAALRAEFGV